MFEQNVSHTAGVTSSFYGCSLIWTNKGNFCMTSNQLWIVPTFCTDLQSAKNNFLTFARLPGRKCADPDINIVAVEID